MLTFKKISFIAAMFLLILALAACGSNIQVEPSDISAENQYEAKQTEVPDAETSNVAEESDTPAFPRTIQHVKGELLLENPPKRIASVDIMSTDYLLVLDIAPIVSEGFSTKERSPIFGKYAKGKEVVDLGGKMNMETLLEMEPDLIVFGSTSNKLERFDEFNKIADTVVIDFSLEPTERLMKFAELVGKEEKARGVIDEFNQLKEQATAVAANHKDETVIFLISNGKDFTVIHPVNFPFFYEGVGLTPVPGLPEDGKIGGRIGIEALSEFNPDHIFIAENRRQMNPEDKDGLINIWVDHSVWKNLDAVEKGQVYSVDTLVGDTFFLGQIAGLQAIIEHLGQ
ncbi:MAG: ABC transporter substrate-binding protein [Paenibacillus macerans]|uniref:ABC transporter substrate-binding protein n=1 Tax=Paenibacillus macerans TaxID=44252 RepID=UPI00242EFC30|nr:ABC transporter substrate-binding protein [Paenibacillus macerans]MDU5945930.1 ABC transporter substrate-binding protein [Paenibacillus macerans]